MTAFKVLLLLAAMLTLAYATPGHVHYEHHKIHVPYKVHFVHHHHIQKVPHVKHIIKEVPKEIYKEVIKEVPIIKEVIKEVPVIKEVHVPVYKEHHSHSDFDDINQW